MIPFSLGPAVTTWMQPAVLMEDNVADDLLELHARIENCLTEIDELEAKYAAWADQNVQLIRKQHGHAAMSDRPQIDAVYGKIIAPLPVTFAAKVGMITNEIRACLDGLACTLADRHGGRDKQTCFPMSASYADFKSEGRKKVRRLSDADQEGIGIYQGDEFLLQLHRMDIERKHIRLGVSGTRGGVILDGTLAIAGGTDVQFIGGRLGGFDVGHITVNGGNMSEVGVEVLLVDGVPRGLEVQPLTLLTIEGAGSQMDGVATDTLRKACKIVDRIISDFD